MKRVNEVRVLAHSLGDTTSDNEAPEGGYLRQLVIPERGRTVVVPVAEIDWIEGDTCYVRVHSRGRHRLLRERMQNLESALNPAHFVRCHRSALVRLELIREIRQDSAFAYSALLATGARVPVSKAKRRQLEIILERGPAS